MSQTRIRDPDPVRYPSSVISFFLPFCLFVHYTNSLRLGHSQTHTHTFGVEQATHSLLMPARYIHSNFFFCSVLFSCYLALQVHVFCRCVMFIFSLYGSGWGPYAKRRRQRTEPHTRICDRSVKSGPEIKTKTHTQSPHMSVRVRVRVRHRRRPTSDGWEREFEHGNDEKKNYIEIYVRCVYVIPSQTVPWTAAQYFALSQVMLSGLFCVFNFFFSLSFSLSCFSLFCYFWSGKKHAHLKHLWHTE